MCNFLANNVVDKACSQYIFSHKTLLSQDRLDRVLVAKMAAHFLH